MRASFTALQAEATAILFGLKYAYKAGYRKVETESDCLHLVEMLTRRKKEKSRVQIDILSFVKQFDTCIFNSANRAELHMP